MLSFRYSFFRFPFSSFTTSFFFMINFSFTVYKPLRLFLIVIVFIPALFLFFFILHSSSIVDIAGGVFLKRTLKCLSSWCYCFYFSYHSSSLLTRQRKISQAHLTFHVSNGGRKTGDAFQEDFVGHNKTAKANAHCLNGRLKRPLPLVGKSISLFLAKYIQVGVWVSLRPTHTRAHTCKCMYSTRKKYKINDNYVCTRISRWDMTKYPIWIIFMFPQKFSCDDIFLFFHAPSSWYDFEILTQRMK